MKYKVLMMVCCASVFSVYAGEFDDTAKVLSAHPQMERVNQPRQECKVETVTVQHQPQRGIGGSVLGGLAGALIGNQVGGGNGRTAATAAGAIAGAVVGDRMENNNSGSGTVSEQQVRNCYMVDNWQSRATGYSVTYDYRGRTYTTVLPYDPGQRLKVRVSVSPTE